MSSENPRFAIDLIFYEVCRMEIVQFTEFNKPFQGGQRELKFHAIRPGMFRSVSV